MVPDTILYPLLGYCKQYPSAANELQEWYYELIQSDFKNFNELKLVYTSASLVGDDRVVLTSWVTSTDWSYALSFNSKSSGSNGSVLMQNMIK